MSNNDLLDLNSILPFGESLLPLLLSSYLTSNDLYQVLKSRGIFMSLSEKENTIPILRGLVLSPIEFDALRIRQKDKEDRPKTTTTHYEIENDRDLIDLVREDKNPINDVIVGQAISYQIEGAPSISILDKNHVYYEYSIIRNDVSKDWANSKSRHEGRVDIEKIGRNITFTAEYTSEETKDLSRRISRRAFDVIKKTAKISDDTKPWRILFDDFENKNRIQFLFGILEDVKYYNEIMLTDVSFGPDKTKPLSEHAAWMKDKVDSLKLKGEKLGEIEFFTEDKYKESMLVEGIEAIIEFSMDVSKYKANVRVGFDGYLKTKIEDTEFVYSLISLSDDKGSLIKSKGIARELQKHINIITVEQYLKYMKKIT